MDVLGKFFGRKIPKLPERFSSRSFSFGGIVRDRRSRNETAPLTHSQAQAALPGIGQALFAGQGLTRETREQFAPFIRIGATHQIADFGGVNPRNVTLSRGTGFQGPSDPVASVMNNIYTPTIPQTSSHTGITSGGVSIGDLTFSGQNVANALNASIGNVGVPNARGGMSYGTNVEGSNYTQIIRDNTGRITGYADAIYTPVISAPANPVIAPLPPELKFGFGQSALQTYTSPPIVIPTKSTKSSSGSSSSKSTSSSLVSQNTAVSKGKNVATYNPKTGGYSYKWSG